MQELEATWARALKVWWLIFWRSVLGASILGGVLGFIISFIGALAGAPSDLMMIINVIVGTIVGVAWMMAVVRMALRRRYRDFRLVMLPNNF